MSRLNGGQHGVRNNRTLPMSLAPEITVPRPRVRARFEHLRTASLAVSLPRAALALAFLVGLSLALRTQAIHARYWIDEGLSVGISSHPVTQIPGLLHQDGSPPLYYVLLSLWVSVFGNGEADTHALSVVFAILTVPAAWFAARALFGHRAAWIAALLAALNPFLTYYAQETRMYALAALLSVAVTGTFVAAFVQGRRRMLPAFGASLLLMILTHNWGLYLGIGTVAALVAPWRAAADRRAFARDVVLTYGGVGLLYLPWLPTLLFQAKHTGAPWSETPALQDVLNGLTTLLGGAAPAMAFALAAGFGLSSLLASPRRAPRARAALAVMTMGAVTLALAWATSQISPSWSPRYFAVLLGPVLLLGAAGMARAGRLGLVVLAILVVFWFNPRTGALNSKSNAHKVAVMLRNQMRPGDLVVVAHPEQGPLMHYYLGGADRLRWVNIAGPVADPAMFDWRDVLHRLHEAKARPTEDAYVRSLRPGQRMLMVFPVVRTASWGAPWTHLVKRRAWQWQHVLRRDHRLLRLNSIPRLEENKPHPRGVRTVLYERR
jgi:MFS family permease